MSIQSTKCTKCFERIRGSEREFFGFGGGKKLASPGRSSVQNTSCTSCGTALDGGPTTEASLHPLGLYDGQGQPVGDSQPYTGPSLLDFAGPRQEWVAIWPLGQEWDRAPALTWLAPLGPFDAMPEVVLGALVAAVDAGSSVLLAESDAICLADAGRLVRGLIGGGRA